MTEPDLVSRILLATGESNLEEGKLATDLYRLSKGEGAFPDVGEKVDEKPVAEQYQVFKEHTFDLGKTLTGYDSEAGVEEHDAKLDGAVFTRGDDPRNPFVLKDFYPKLLGKLTNWLGKNDDGTSFVIIRPSDIELSLNTPDEQDSDTIVVEYQGKAKIYFAGKTA